MTGLFDPITLRDVRARNRVWVSPMCLYSCEGLDGAVGDFHLVHYGSFAVGGAGLVVTEATAVAPQGRLTPQDAGIWDDGHVPAWRRVVDVVHASGAAICVQLAHAGRKASKYRELPDATGGRGPIPDAEGGWQPFGVTGAPFGRLRTPRELTGPEVAALVPEFARAARRAVAAGFDGVELHAGHGYLLHELLSPVTNRRTDAWGGRAGGERLLLAVVDAVRAELGPGRALLVRLSASDVVPGGSTVPDTVDLAVRLHRRGVDLVDCSSGGLEAGVEYAPAPGYQVPGAAAVRAAGVPSGAVGLIAEPAQAQQVIGSGAADAVLLGRAMLRDPHWARHAAHALGRTDALDVPVPYLRAWHPSALEPLEQP
ncbi:MAG TPA: NADH:flavin oxidoreductase/NADH oxidase [Cellulomonas sp.]